MNKKLAMSALVVALMTGSMQLFAESTDDMLRTYLAGVEQAKQCALNVKRQYDSIKGRLPQMSESEREQALNQIVSAASQCPGFERIAPRIRQGKAEKLAEVKQAAPAQQAQAPAAAAGGQGIPGLQQRAYNHYRRMGYTHDQLQAYYNRGALNAYKERTR